jgi:DNA-binding SARP family transcriptional activator/TolB-like protein
MTVRSSVVPSVMAASRAFDSAASRREPTPRKTVRIHLFGAMQAVSYTGQSMLPRSRKARAIVAYLALARGQPVPRARLASLLWDRVTDAQSRASLRQALSELTAVWSSAESFIEITRESVRLRIDECWIDALALIESRGSPDIAPEGDLLRNISGRLLEDLDGITASCDEWLGTERSYFEDRLRELHEQRLAYLAEQKAPPMQRVQAARALVEFDPTHERGWQMLMKALVEMGDRAQAMREYQRCCEALRRLLDVEPSRETRSVRDALQVVSAATAQARDPQDGPPILGPANSRTRLRVGILPFDGAGPADDPSLPWSLALDTAAALARFRWFDVVAPIALAGLRAGDADWQERLRELDLDYLVQGSLKIAGGKIRVRVVLLDVHEIARPVWDDSYELPLHALAEADERVTAKIVARIDPIILFIEGTRPKRSWSDATGLVLKSIPLMYKMDADSYAEAGRLLTRATTESPDHSMAAAWMAFWYMFNVTHGWSKDPAGEYLEAERLSRKAFELDPENAEALGIYAHLCSFVHHDFEAAAQYFDRSLVLNPSLAFVWALSAPTSCYIGNPQDALFRLQRYRELAPLDPYFKLFETIYVVAYVFARDYEKAVTVGRRAVRANPAFTNGYKPLLAALGHLGRVEEAQKFLRELLRQEPGFSIQSFAARYPFGRDEDRKQYVDGLRKAGVPNA